MDLRKFPNCPIRVREHILRESVAPVASASAEYYESRFDQKEVITDCTVFYGMDLSDAARGDFGALRKVGFFPTNQVSFESMRALDHLTFGMYRSAYDSMRRALELSVVGAYFLMDEIPRNEANAWLSSELDTPNFSRAVERLSSESPGSVLVEATDWKESLKTFFWRLCDIVHVKGEVNGYLHFDQARTYSMSYALTEFSDAQFVQGLTDYIETTRFVASVVTLANPPIVVGVPLDEKFGLNPPICGFFTDVQAERLHRLMHTTVSDCLSAWATTSEEIRTVQDYFRSMPDLTHAELKAQSEDFQRLMNANETPSSGS